MGKTFLSLFSSFDKSELCQLYIHPSIPDVDICNSYYNISDKQILKLGLFGKAGKEISAHDINEAANDRLNGVKTVSPANWKGIHPLKCILRDTMWSVSKWFSPELNKWLDREAPSAIFLAPGYAKFIYNITLKIAISRNLPVITYICDDYYFVNPPKTLLGKIYLNSLRKITDKLLNNTEFLIVISEELKRVYSSHFLVDTQVIMIGADDNKLKISKSIDRIQNISYFGNLGLGRHVPLAEIGHIIDSINSKFDCNIQLNIYTNENSREVLSVFDNIKSANIKGFISGKAFDEALRSADLLIHTESFNAKYIDMVKHSVSTKIADSLASGIPLLAYGPADISSIKHLIRNKCAVVATDPEELKEKLFNLVLNNIDISSISEHAKNTAKAWHDTKVNSLNLKSIFKTIEEQFNERASNQGI